jgi:branched-chain amino acid transport system permease protein
MGLRIIIQAFINGISLSFIYILFALGLTLIMSVFDICNFAYGEFIMVGGFVAYFVVGKWGLPYILAFIAAMVIVSLLGIVFEKGIFYPMHNRSGLEPALATFGASGALQTIALLLFGGNYKGVPPIISGQAHIGSTFFLFVERTKLGLAIRAVQQDQEAAALQGINIANIRMVVWVVASCLAAVAGILLASISYVDPFVGTGLLLKGFAVVIMGGMGSIPGALVGGFALGFVDSFGQTYIGTASYMFAFGFIILVLLLRPQGLLGKR